jgi:hypothetical protein
MRLYPKPASARRCRRIAMIPAFFAQIRRGTCSAGNLELIRYYRDRSVWLIEPDQSEAGANPARVSPYRFEESME